MQSKINLSQDAAKWLLSRIEDDYGYEDFLEKLSDYPEQYLQDLCLIVIDFLQLSGRLK